MKLQFRSLLAAVSLVLWAAGPGDTTRAAEDEPPGDDAPPARVVPVFDPGSHVRPIADLGFSADGKRLITAGSDYTIQVWNVATGERVDVFRLPPYGQEEGYNPKSWDVAAVSPTGRFVAVGGGQKLGLSEGNALDRAKLVLVDVEQRTLKRLTPGVNGVTALTFSADESTLVVATGGQTPKIVFVENIGGARPRARRRGARKELSVPGAKRSVINLAFSADESRLVASGPPGFLCGWDLSKESDQPAFTAEALPETSALVWAPDAKSFVRTRIAVGSAGHKVEKWGADGKLIQEWIGGDEATSNVFDKRHLFWDARWKRGAGGGGGSEVYLAANIGGDGLAGRAGLLVFDVQAGKARKIAEFEGGGRYSPKCAISPDGKLAAITVEQGLDTILFRMSDGTEISRCGAKSPAPSVVAWSKTGTPRIAWSESFINGRMNTDIRQLEVAFDLQKLELISEFDPGDFQPCQMAVGKWRLSESQSGNNFLQLTEEGGSPREYRIGNRLSAATLITQGESAPLVMLSAKQAFRGTGLSVVFDAKGATVARLLPPPVAARDVAPSPDGKYLLTSTGTHRLCIHKMDGSKYPVLSLARVRGDWIAWTPSGHYVGTPGGERMFGWAVHRGHNEFAGFESSDKFEKYFRSPDVLRRAIDLVAKVEGPPKIEERAPDVSSLLPPRAGLQLVKQTGNRVQVRGVATPEAKDKPVKSLRLLLDGKAISGVAGLFTVPSGKPAETTWEVEVPAGPHELKLLAKGDEGSAVSDPLVVKGPSSVGKLPTLHRLCVGVGEYRNSAYNLASAAKDAQDLFGALEKLCVGPENRFGNATGKLLTDQQATSPAILAAIDAIRLAAKPGDLVVIQFAGHGVKQGNEYYLMSVESDPSKSLTGSAVSGTNLREHLSKIECPVLLVLDACHAASGARALLPVTADLTRNLADETAGVTVMAAAMAHEKASGTEANGYFTAGLLKGLAVGPEAFDPYDHVLYTHHVFSVAFSEVRRASKGRQNPCLTSPWTMSPLGLRATAESR